MNRLANGRREEGDTCVLLWLPPCVSGPLPGFSKLGCLGPLGIHHARRWVKPLIGLRCRNWGRCWAWKGLVASVWLSGQWGRNQQWEASLEIG